MRTTTFLAPTLLACALAAAEPAADGVVTTPSIDVSATRLGSQPIDQPFTYTRLRRDDLDDANARTAVDALGDVTGIYVQRTSTAQASPFIRGLTGYQTLQLFDGVRYNHMMNRSGPNQYAALLPDVSIGRIDVVAGSGSTVQGSDGITGTIDYRLAEAGRGATTAISPFVKIRAASAEGYTAAGGIDGRIAGADLAYTLEGSWSDWARRTGGGDSGDRLYGGARGDSTIPNTDYSEYSYAGRVAWTGLDRNRLELSAGRSKQLHAPRTDGYYENANLTSRISRYFDPQQFTYVHLRDRVDLPGWLPALAVTTWYHRQDETQVREQITGNRYRKEEWTDAITTVGGDVQMDGRIDLLGVQHWTWGGTYYRDASDNGYQRWQTAVGNLDPATATNATTGLLEDQSTTLPDNSTYIGQALFVQNDWRFDERWNAVAGLRWSRSSWNAFVRNGRTGFVGDQNIHGSADAWTGSLRLGWQVLDPVLIYGGASQGFRAPSLTDIAGDTVSPVSGITTRPNPDLQAERAITYEIGAKAEEGPQRASLAFFWTRIGNQIQGQYIDSDGNGSIDTGRPVNGQRADLRGFELAFDATVPGLDLGLGRRLSVFNTITAVDGESRVQAANGTTARANVPRANLVWGQAGVKMQGAAWYALAQVRWAGKYGEPTAEQGSDPRFYTVRGDVTSSDGAVPGWAVVDLKGGWTASPTVRVDAGIENVLDRTYRSAGSSADGTGLNGVLTVSARY